jgi:hypothetical protein
LSLDKEETKMGGKVNKQGQANGPYLGGFIGGPDRGPNNPYQGGFAAAQNPGNQGPYQPGMPPQMPQGANMGQAFQALQQQPKRPQQPLNSYSSIGGMDPNVMQNFQNRFPGIQLPGMPPQGGKGPDGGPNGPYHHGGKGPDGGPNGPYHHGGKGPDRAGPQMPPQMPNPGMQGMNPGQIMQMLQMQNSQQPRAGLGAISGVAPTGYM